MITHHCKTLIKNYFNVTIVNIFNKDCKLRNLLIQLRQPHVLITLTRTHIRWMKQLEMVLSFLISSIQFRILMTNLKNLLITFNSSISLLKSNTWMMNGAMVMWCLATARVFHSKTTKIWNMTLKIKITITTLLIVTFQMNYSIHNFSLHYIILMQCPLTVIILNKHPQAIAWWLNTIKAMRLN